MAFTNLLKIIAMGLLLGSNLAKADAEADAAYNQFRSTRIFLSNDVKISQFKCEEGKILVKNSINNEELTLIFDHQNEESLDSCQHLKVIVFTLDSLTKRLSLSAKIQADGIHFQGWRVDDIK